MFPPYEELKSIKDYYTYSLWYPTIGGYFRLTRNENGENTVSLDYLEQGYITPINTVFKSKYHFNQLYKFNKKNYTELMKLYCEMVEYHYKDVSTMMNTVINSRDKHSI